MGTAMLIAELQRDRRRPRLPHRPFTRAFEASETRADPTLPEE